MSTLRSSPFTEKQLAQYPYNQVLPANAFIPSEADSESEFWAYFVQKQPKLGSEPISVTIKELGRLNPRNLTSVVEKLHTLGYHTKVVIDHWSSYQTDTGKTAWQPFSALRIGTTEASVSWMRDAPQPANK